ncbi:MAG TPA: carboxypeptidase-like regulatory domain-containing protein, partial [Pyrinomonadaceae bacterium]|nr:carboxypeptidase-like regulatory domain-containing protein [Pyrinomonadaceae bacterium]
NATVFGCGQCAFPTFDAIIAAYPNAKIVTWYALTDGYGTQFVAGQNSAGSPWANFDGNIDAFTIAVSAPDTTFDFEPLAPTAASVSISGQVLTATGQSVPNARVFLTDNLGVKRAAISNGFGYYSFESVTVGETYVLSVVSKRYTFTPQAVNVNEELTALNLIAEL